ncbi:MAG: hypothetical protein GX828_02285 [Clostridiales bacterium]|nr:hypothetical protein [Clostridiales bacterium]
MRGRFAIAGFFVAVLMFSLFTAFGDTLIPGGPDDPVVTKSYVDSSLAFKVLNLKEGQTLIGKEGTEIIIRSGEITAIDNGANGVSDITQGTDLMTGTKCKANHFLIIPRSDGRGIKALTESYVMIRGDYTLE